MALTNDVIDRVTMEYLRKLDEKRSQTREDETQDRLPQEFKCPIQYEKEEDDEKA